MKVKLDGHSIICPQETTFQGDFYGTSEIELCRSILSDLHQLERTNIWPMYTIKVDEVKFTKGFKIDAKTNR